MNWRIFLIPCTTSQRYIKKTNKGIKLHSSLQVNIYEIFYKELLRMREVEQQVNFHYQSKVLLSSQQEFMIYSNILNKPSSFIFLNILTNKIYNLKPQFITSGLFTSLKLSLTLKSMTSFHTFDILCVCTIHCVHVAV